MINEKLYGAVRRYSLELADPLSAEDCMAQSMPDASPVKWHLAHTTWFFETFILERFEPGFAPFQQDFRFLFNSYYNGIGARHPRAQRGLLTRPSLADVHAYRADAALPDAAPGRARWISFDPGVTGLGFNGTGFCFDNELPRHRVFLEPYSLSSRLVSNGEYLAFVEAGGYRDPSLWLSEGWDAVRNGGWAHPLYWRRGDGGAWQEFTLRGLAPLAPGLPVMPLSMYEADAYARWAGARLPTEAEWEHAAASSGIALDQLFGHCWQWTSSSYAPYPGYAAAPGAVGEYNGKFMVNQYVLRGSSIGTPAGHARASYRNFFPAGARWQFTGLRLAK